MTLLIVSWPPLGIVGLALVFEFEVIIKNICTHTIYIALQEKWLHFVHSTQQVEAKQWHHITIDWLCTFPHRKTRNNSVVRMLSAREVNVVD
jgi:hypothetical protein